MAFSDPCIISFQGIFENSRWTHINSDQNHLLCRNIISDFIEKNEMTKAPRPLEIINELQINAYDIDVAGIVHNLVYIRWFEDMRMRFLDRYLPFEDLLKQDISPVLAHTEIDYKLPLKFQDKPVISMWVGSLGRAKWELYFEIKKEGRLVCRGRQVGYFVHLKRMRPVPVPATLLDEYHRYTESK